MTEKRDPEKIVREIKRKIRSKHPAQISLGRLK
jgi:hypothetical protein